MANGILSVILTNLSFVPLAGQDGPILADIDGDIVMTSVDDFPAHKLTLDATDARAVRSIDPSILPCGCIITEEGMGEVARGYIEDPQAQLNEQGHTITLTIPNQTEALRWDTTGPGWVAATGIDTIANRLASRAQWQASVVDTGDPVVSVMPVHWQANDPTTSNADLNSLTKDDGIALGWNVGALSQEFAVSGDCAITAVAFGCNTYRMFGFTHAFNTYSYEMLDHAIFLSNDGKNLPTSGLLGVYESGVLRTLGAPGSYYPGDILSVAIVGGVVQYLINNTVFYVSTVAPTYPVFGACSIYSPNAAILGATWTKYVAPKDTYYAVAYENATILDAELQLATATFRHIRQKQVGGVNVNALELGLFNAAPTMVLKTADGESPAQVRARNTYTRLIEPEVDYSYTSSQVITIGAAFGGGTGDTQVKLGNLYDYLHPPAQQVIDPITGALVQRPLPAPTPRIGQPSIPNAPAYYPLFPEYDAANFPIERRVSLKGTYYYVVKNVPMVAAMKAKGHWSGEIWGAIDNSAIVYVDKSPDAQKMAVERTLYVDCVTKLKRHQQIDFAATIQTDGRGRITQAGDLVNVQINRTGRQRSLGGARVFAEANINVNPMVTSVIRQYRDANITDKWAVSSLGRLLTDDSRALTDTLRSMEAIRLIPTTQSQTVLVGPTEQTINTIYPLDIPVELPNTMYKMTSASLYVSIKPARHNVRLTQGAQLDGAHTHTVPIPPLTVNIFPLPPHGHTGYTVRHDHAGGLGILGVGGSTSIDHTQAFNKGGHSHLIKPVNPFIDTGVPDGSNALKFDTTTINGQIVVTHVALHAFLNQQGGGGHTHGEDPASDTYQTPATVDSITGVNRTLAGGAATIGTLVDTVGTPTANDNGGNLIGMTTATGSTTTPPGTDATNGGAHTHNLFPDIQETNLGGFIQIWINSGDGVYVDRSPELGGPWNGVNAAIKGNVFVDSNGAQVSGTGLERFLQAPGKVVGVRVVAVNSAGNPTGICNVQVHGTWEFDKNAISSTIFAGSGG